MTPGRKRIFDGVYLLDILRGLDQSVPLGGVGKHALEKVLDGEYGHAEKVQHEVERRLGGYGWSCPLT